jgi:hypothetical protein
MERIMLRQTVSKKHVDEEKELRKGRRESIRYTL